MTTVSEMMLRIALQNVLLAEQSYNDYGSGDTTTQTLKSAWEAMIFAAKSHLPAVLEELQRLRCGEKDTA